MNGMFDTDFLTPLKGYYPFLMFSTLYKLGNSINTNCECEEIYSAAAIGENEAAVLVSYFDDDDRAIEKQVRIEISNLPEFASAEVEYYLLDEEHDNELVSTEKVNTKTFDLQLNMSLYSTYLIRIKLD